uniref:Uncharacterized protein n=1 Tax=Cajanus cajan TaxID=3821 RepID=A0A151TER7_CAJCA|nr:hypothetical protein KK1_011793 [Cajanus cajan]
MLSRSSSVVTVMRLSRSSLGSWYLSVKGLPLRMVRESFAHRSFNDEWRSTTTILVSPPT